MVTVKNCEGSQILLTCKVNKLACDRFMIAGREYETLGLETKGSLRFIEVEVTRLSSFFVLVTKPQFPQGGQTGPDDTSTHIGCVIGEKP